MRAQTVAAVILAAGASSRMGRQKLLLPLAGQPLVARVAGRVLASNVDEVVVVLGRDADLVRSALGDERRLRFVENLDYRDGMGGSFRAGIESLSGDVSAAMFVLADQPFVTTEMLNALLATFRRSEPLAVVSRFGGVVAPPHVFAREVFPKLGLPRNEGAKALLAEYPDRCVTVDHLPEGLLDVDDPESYRRALALENNEA